jgi:hypothetical protein
LLVDVAGPADGVDDTDAGFEADGEVEAAEPGLELES